VRGSDPPRCVVHRRHASASLESNIEGAKGKNFYGHIYSVEEIADLVAREADESLEDEITATRVATRRVMEQLQKELDPIEYGRLARVVFAGSNTLAQLLRTQRVLTGGSEDGIARAIAEALDELEDELGLKL